MTLSFILLLTLTVKKNRILVFLSIILCVMLCVIGPNKIDDLLSLVACNVQKLNIVQASNIKILLCSTLFGYTKNSKGCLMIPLGDTKGTGRLSGSVIRKATISASRDTESSSGHPLVFCGKLAYTIGLQSMWISCIDYGDPLEVGRHLYCKGQLCSCSPLWVFLEFLALWDLSILVCEREVQIKLLVITGMEDWILPQAVYFILFSVFLCLPAGPITPFRGDDSVSNGAYIDIPFLRRHLTMRTTEVDAGYSSESRHIISI
jgi:hypothetical protein